MTFWLFAGPAIALALVSLRGERKRAAYVSAALAARGAASPPRATVIVPVKGHEEGLRENLQSLRSLDYPDYELLVAAHVAADIPPGVLPSGIKVVLAGEDRQAVAAKIHNLLAGVRAARKNSTVLAFADSDGRAPRGWLRALAAPLGEEGVGASTGYRWYLPDPPDFWSLVRSVWNAPIAGTLGPADNAFAWGGSMAIRKELFSELAIPDHWKGAISDDFTLSAVVHAAGLRVAFAPGALVASTDHTGARGFFTWAKRQMILTRVHQPRLWWTALAAHVLYCAGMAAAITASIMGNRFAEWALIAQLSPGMLKGTNRATLAKAGLADYKPWFDRHGWVHTWWVPLATWIWLITLLSSAFSHVIEWRGNRYDLSRRDSSSSPQPPADSGIQ